MKVGDLVKVYNFSHRARDKFRRDGMQNVDDHFVGLIVGGRPNRGFRRVLMPDGDTEFFNLDRMEIINASR
jgi:hypothetical protein